MAKQLQRGWWKPVVRVLLAAYPGRMALGAFLATLAVAAAVGLLGLSGWFITATAIAGLQLSTALVFDVFMPAAGIRGLAMGRTLARYGERLVTHDATLATLAILRERLFLGWAQSAGGDLLRSPAQTLYRLTSDLDSLESISLRLMVPAAAAFGVTLLCAIVFGVITPWLGVLAGVWLLLVGLGVTLALARQARGAMVNYSLAIERLRSRAIDLVSGQTDLLMSGQLARQRALLERDNRRVLRSDHRLQRLELKAAAAHSVAASLTLVFALLAVGLLVDQGVIGTPVAVLVLLMALGAMEPFSALRRGGLEAGRTWLAARRLARPLAAEPQAQAVAVPARPAVGQALQIENASARYPGSGRDVLQHISLHVGVGERVALVGASGSGKSSLMALVTGELKPVSGKVLALEHAWLSQRTDLFKDSVRNNLLLAAPEATDAQLWAALGVAGLAADVKAMPAQLDTGLGEAALGLSGGQARRLALARLLLQDRSLWLLDEPSDGLDAATAQAVLADLDISGRDKSWLLATHLQREARLADRLLVLHEGRIVAQHQRGSPAFDNALSRLRID